LSGDGRESDKLSSIPAKKRVDGKSLDRQLALTTVYIFSAEKAETQMPGFPGRPAQQWAVKTPK
jgi:hypothetical protein